MKPNKKYYDTVVEATNDLRKRGYSADFEILAEKGVLTPVGEDKKLSPEDFQIDEIHRFEGNTDPGDEMIVYAISSANNNLKGVVINAFGPYADAETAKIVSRLKRKEG